jgi:hypothetical protein
MSTPKPDPRKPSAESIGEIVYAVLIESFSKLPRKLQDKLMEANPRARKKAAVIYVGKTRLEAEARYANHLAGYKSSRLVEKHRRQLIVLDRWKPEFPFAISPRLTKAIYLLARRSRADGAKREAEVAGLLRDAGFFVHSA